ncbi:oligopeptidase A [Eupeodes corollae]|uniref:oligopeptidase A n=1 Tax=Eupeodes corollae TaxID=290404 RepID=UPI0024914711|nr:oligopeptidase A [Eupeodes corollae]
MLSTIFRQKYLFFLQRQISTTKCNKGYIVLVPEIGEDACSMEALLKPDGLPHFDTITIETCMGAIGHQALDIENKVKDLETRINSEENVDSEKIFKELDVVTGPLDTTWGIAKALYMGNSTLIPTKSYINIHDRARNARASKFNSKTIYDTIEKEYNSNPNVEHEKSRLMKKYLLEGKLNGLNLSEKDNDILKDVLLNLGKERAHFKNKVNVSVNNFVHNITNFNMVRDFPSNLLESMALDPNQPANGPWRVSLQPQMVKSFLKYCPDRTERWNIWQANNRKASGQSEKSLENSSHLEKIRALRKRQANLLGYKTYVEMSMQTKMIKDVKNAKQIFAKLLQYAGPRQSVEIQSLQEFAQESGFDQNLDQYDIPYWQRKYLRSKFDLNEETIKEFFPLPRVFSGLFKFSEELFNIKILERNSAAVWHPDVKYYDVYDASDASKPIGGFYVDCYSKENRFGNNSGWMVGIKNRNVLAGNNPLCGLVFNFNEPLYGKPHLLSIDDLRIVFKTFGTTLQHLLTQANYTDLSGLSNIEWDASQVSGQVLANFLDNDKALKEISGHYATDEPLPGDVMNNIKLLKKNMAGYNLCNELYLSDLDLELHQSDDFWLDIVKKLWPVYQCLPLDKKDAHPCSMVDIFSGDWAAAYFSHLYSKVLAADIYDAFSEENKSPAEIGQRFRDTFLSTGGAVCTAEVFRRFRGRDPSVEALLKSLDLLHPSQTISDL